MQTTSVSNFYKFLLCPYGKTHKYPHALSDVGVTFNQLPNTLNIDVRDHWCTGEVPEEIDSRVADKSISDWLVVKIIHICHVQISQALAWIYI